MDSINNIDRGQLLMWILVSMLVVANVGFMIVGWIAGRRKERRRRFIDGG